MHTTAWWQWNAAEVICHIHLYSYSFFRLDGYMYILKSTKIYVLYYTPCSIYLYLHTRVMHTLSCTSLQLPPVRVTFEVYVCPNSRCQTHCPISGYIIAIYWVLRGTPVLCKMYINAIATTLSSACQASMQRATCTITLISLNLVRNCRETS